MPGLKWRTSVSGEPRLPEKERLVELDSVDKITCFSTSPVKAILSEVCRIPECSLGEFLVFISQVVADRKRAPAAGSRRVSDVETPLCAMSSNIWESPESLHYWALKEDGSIVLSVDEATYQVLGLSSGLVHRGPDQRVFKFHYKDFLPVCNPLTEKRGCRMTKAHVLALNSILCTSVVCGCSLASLHEAGFEGAKAVAPVIASSSWDHQMLFARRAVSRGVDLSNRESKMLPVPQLARIFESGNAATRLALLQELVEFSGAVTSNCYFDRVQNDLTAPPPELAAMKVTLKRFNVFNGERRSTASRSSVNESGEAAMVEAPPPAKKPWWWFGLGPLLQPQQPAPATDAAAAGCSSPSSPVVAATPPTPLEATAAASPPPPSEETVLRMRKAFVTSPHNMYHVWTAAEILLPGGGASFKFLCTQLTPKSPFVCVVEHGGRISGTLHSERIGITVIRAGQLTTNNRILQVEVQVED